ncbi:MAG: dehydrogenase, partial [Abitibacteriaceae bacterium]|nr:dehydrogenase [Abditibacteriaceae bacterium]
MNEANSILERLFSLQGKAALITGASGGIGRALAVGLAEAGAA